MSYLEWIGPAVLPTAVVSVLAVLALISMQRASSAHRHAVLGATFVALGLAVASPWIHLPVPVTHSVTMVEQRAITAVHMEMPWFVLAWAPLVWLTMRYTIGCIAVWMLRRQASPLGGRRGVLVAKRAPTAFACGLLRPAIILPSGYLALEQDVLEAIIRHEAAHIRQGDPLLIPLVGLMQGVLWWNPLVHILARRWRLESERAADDAALDLGIEPARYARQLIDLAQGLAGRTPLAGSALIGRERMRNRVLAVLNPNIRRQTMNKRSKWMTIGVCGAIAVSLSVVAQARWNFAKTQEEPNLRVEYVQESDTEGSLYITEDDGKPGPKSLSVNAHGDAGDVVFEAIGTDGKKHAGRVNVVDKPLTTQSDVNHVEAQTKVVEGEQLGEFWEEVPSKK